MSMFVRLGKRGNTSVAWPLCAALVVLRCGTSSEEVVRAGSGEGQHDAMSPAAVGTPSSDAGSSAQAPTDSSPQDTDDSTQVEPSPPVTDPSETAQPASEAPAATPLELKGDAENYRIVRLTHRQWELSVRQLLRSDEDTGLFAGFTPDPLVNTFSNDEAFLEVGDALEADYAVAAQTIAARATIDAVVLARVQPQTEPGEFIREFGRRAFRRPLTSAEQARYLTLYDAGVEHSPEADFLHGVQLVIEAMLQAPQFLYRSELGDDEAPLDGFEVASKLSFALRETAPDTDWLDRAEQGQFDTEEGVANAAQELFDAPPTLLQMRSYHSQVLRLGRLAEIAKSSDSNYDVSLNPPLELAAHLFFEDIYQNHGVRDIFEGHGAWISPELAPLYGVSEISDGWQQVQLPSRQGFFTQLPFLILHSTNLTPDPIHRGAELQAHVLCGTLTAPFTGIELPAAKAGATNRQYVQSLTEQGECAACHANYINPLGFAFENFDGLGQVRTVDNGQAIDTSGAYPFTEGLETFADANELMSVLATSTQVHECYVKHLGEFLLARQLSNADKDTLQQLAQGSLEGQSVKDLILGWVKSPQFRTRTGAGE